MNRTPDDLRQMLVEDLEEIESACARYAQGQISAYQTVAVQLRNLLADTNPKSGPLLTRVIPDATFEALRAPIATDSTPKHLGGNKYSVQALAFDARGSLVLPADGPVRLELAVQPNHLVTPGDWIADWVIRPEIVLRKLIQEVANKDVAHTDSSAGETMTNLERALVWNRNGATIQIARPVLCGIGSYVAHRVRQLIDA